jgi:hypothetical protein
MVSFCDSGPFLYLNVIIDLLYYEGACTLAPHNQLTDAMLQFLEKFIAFFSPHTPVVVHDPLLKPISIYLLPPPFLQVSFPVFI